VYEQTSKTIHREKHRVPTASPSKRRGGALDASIALRHVRVISFCDCALLCAERGRRARPHTLARFRLDTALRRQRIANKGNCRECGHDMCERFRADISRDTVTDA